MSYKLVRKGQNPLEKEWAEDTNRDLPEEAKQPKNIQKSSTSFVIRKMQMKTTGRHRFTPNRLGSLKENTSKSKGVERQETPAAGVTVKG